MEARTRKTNPRSRRRQRKSTGATQGPLGGQWRLFEALLPIDFRAALIFSFLCLGFTLYFWRNLSFLAMAVGFVASSVALKAYSVATRNRNK